MAKRRYAPPAHKPNLFYQFSPEAFFLTVFGQYQHFLVMSDAKKRNGLSGRAAGSLASEVAAIGLT
jgi:hypothetical protein